MKAPSLKRSLAFGMKSLLILALIYGSAASAYAGNIRGMLYRRASDGRTYPAPYVRVTLNHAQYGRSSPADTGPDGMYYFYNVQPGDYWLEVWVGSKPLVFTIRVYNQPLTDIPPIQIP
jgi:hypothetical protein